MAVPLSYRLSPALRAPSPNGDEMKLIIQIPCFNEEMTLPTTLSRLPGRLEGVDEIEVLVIDDGSTDGTAERARECGVKHVIELGKHQGLSAAFREGLDTCLKLGADIIVNTDGDNQYCGEDVEALVRPILQGQADLVIGTRDISSIHHFTSLKKWLQKIGSWVVRKAGRCSIADTTSGFRAFNREAALRTIVHSKFSYTLETLIQAGASPMRLVTVPIRVNEKLRDSHLADSTWQYVKKSAVTILRIYAMYNPLQVFLAIGGLSFFMGFLLGLRYLYFYFLASASGHIQSLILSAILMIVGFQIMIIGLVADLIGANRRLSEDILYRVRKLELYGEPGSPTVAQKSTAASSSKWSQPG
jgi:glycosyltransferase involved in cell wall biosynthesis